MLKLIYLFLISKIKLKQIYVKIISKQVVLVNNFIVLF